MWNIQKMVARQKFENRHRTEMNAVANLLHIVYPSIQICHVLKILAKNSNFQSVTQRRLGRKKPEYSGPMGIEDMTFWLLVQMLYY